MLSTSDFKNVCTSLWPARYKWQAIGIAVGVDFSTIMVIKKDNDDTDERFLVMVDKWLRSNNPVPCWKNLTIALESINIKVLHRAGIEYTFLLD